MFEQLKSLTSIDMFRCLGGPEVNHLTVVRDILGSIPGAGKDFYVCFFVLYLFVQNPLYVMKFCNSFALLAFSILNVLQNVFTTEYKAIKIQT